MEILDEDVVPSFKLHKRIFQDLTNKDIKNNVTGPLLIPPLVQQFLNQPQPNPVAPQTVHSAGPSEARQPRPKRRRLIADYSYEDLTPEVPVDFNTVEVLSEPTRMSTGHEVPQDANGTGMGEGDGVKDVSDQIDDEDQLIGIEKPSDEKAASNEVPSNNLKGNRDGRKL